MFPLYTVASRSLEIQRVKETADHCSERSVISAPAQAAIKNREYKTFYNELSLKTELKIRLAVNFGGEPYLFAHV